MISKVSMSNKKENDFNISLTRLLVCPISGGALYYDNNYNYIFSMVAKFLFPLSVGVSFIFALESRVQICKSLFKTST